VIELDLEELDWRGAVTGLGGLFVALAFIGLFGPVGMAAGIAALFVVAADADDVAGPDRAQVVLVVAGSAITSIVGHAADSTITAAVVIAAVTLGATLLVLLGPRYATSGAFALMWAVLTLSIGATDESADTMALAFAAGGAIALAALAIADRLAPPQPATDAPTRGVPSAEPPSRWAIEVFAVVRALAAGLCVVIGYESFEDHAAWVVLTFVLVLRPPKEQTAVVAVGRTLGTLGGVVLGIVAAQVVGDETWMLLAAFLVAGFFMVATTNVNYALSTAFTTTLLLLSERILQDDVYSTGWTRLLATLTGVAMAFAVIAIMAATTQLRNRSTRGSP
jgi:uncharacterized membrane protein YccC